MAEPIFGSAHFPDNCLRGFFIDPYTNKLMMTKASTPFGSFSDLQWSEPTVAFERTRVTECRLHYMPGDFLYALAEIKDVPVLLYYDVANEIFLDVVEVLWTVLGLKSTSLKQSILLEWELPSAQHLLDRIVVRRKLGDYPDSIDDGVEVFNGVDTSLKDGNLEMGSRYYYRFFPVSTEGDIVDETQNQQIDDQPLDICTALYILHSNYTLLQGIRVVDSNNEDYNVGVLAQNSLGRISDSEVSNKGSGLNSTYNSYLISQNNIGQDNEIALHAETGGTIAKVGEQQPKGIQDELVEEGGIII